MCQVSCESLQEELQAEIKKEAEQHARLKKLASMYEESTDQLQVLKLEKEELRIKLQTAQVREKQAQNTILELKGLFKHEQKQLRNVHRQLDSTQIELQNLRSQLEEEQQYEIALIESLKNAGFDIPSGSQERQTQQKHQFKQINMETIPTDDGARKLKKRQREIDQILKVVSYNRENEIKEHRRLTNNRSFKLNRI